MVHFIVTKDKDRLSVDVIDITDAGNVVDELRCDEFFCPCRAAVSQMDQGDQSGQETGRCLKVGTSRRDVPNELT